MNDNQDLRFMRLGNSKKAVFGALIVALLLGVGGTIRNQDSWEATPRSQNHDIEGQDPDDFVDDFVTANYARLAIDTTRAEPMIAVRIETNGNFDQLEALGLNTGSEKGSRWGNVLSTSIPVRMIPTIWALESVRRIDYSLRGRLLGQSMLSDYGRADKGVVVGQISGLGRIEGIKYWVFLESSNDAIKDTIVVKDSTFFVSRLLAQEGRFRIKGIQNGVYKAKIISRPVSDDMEPEMSDSPNDKVLMVIDGIVVKAGYTSVIDLVVTPDMSQGVSDSVKWEPKYRQ